ncbi:MAG: hypothetical protein V1705_01650 [bacterium]
MVLGHQKQLQFLKKSAESDRLAHAYLFSGPAQIGKKTIAKEWASRLLGENVQSAIQPDLILLEPDPESGEIEIGQIRELIWKLSLKPAAAALKVAILNDCHLMNQHAQNCFLKTLEEPKGDTVLILVTDRPRVLLPTIASRCQEIKFYPVARKEIDKYLLQAGKSADIAEEIGKIAAGFPGRAIELVEFPEKLNDYRETMKDIEKILNGSLAARFQYAQKTADREDLLEVLKIWLAYFRNNLISGAGDKKIKNILLRIQKIFFLLSTTNVSRRLAVEILMLEL